MEYQKEYINWLNSPALTQAEKEELRGLSEEEKKDRFFSLLQFGTAGLRGLLGTGSFRMNIYTVRHATQALAQLLLREFPQPGPVAVAYDSRHFSKEFAYEACRVLAGNGIRTYLFDELRPTPELSFAVRELRCAAGINITASHNPKEYNGYKVYWEDGAQISPAHAQAIAGYMEKLDLFRDVKVAPGEQAQHFVTMLGKAFDEKYLDNVLAQIVNPDAIRKHADLKIIYTPFHGSGYRLVPEVLRRAGFQSVHLVREQMVLDGDFPTVASPNPENKEGFTLAMRQADEIGCDLIIGTDPDADRVGVVVRKSDGDYAVMTGNQTGAVLLDYLIKAKKEKGALPANACVVKSIVTSDLGAEICKKNGVAVMNVLTGFKFIGEKMEEFQQKKNYTYLFGYEESYGCLVGEYARDKDAVVASLLIAEAAAYYAEQKMTLWDVLNSLFAEYGYHKEKVLNIEMAGAGASQKMADLMASLRKDSAAQIGGVAVVQVLDYLRGVEGLPPSDVMYYKLEDGSVVVVRPSGTEPKMKVYMMTSAAGEAQADRKIRAFEADLKKILPL